MIILLIGLLRLKSEGIGARSIPECGTSSGRIISRGVQINFHRRDAERR
jgi:hypothetical protein